MQGHNDRLAYYIQLNRMKEKQLECLREEVTTVEETKSTEIVRMRQSYDQELNKVSLAQHVSFH